MDLFGFWKVPDRPRAGFDSLIVLSYAVKSDLFPTAPTRAVIDLAIAKWKKNPQAAIIMSTGDNHNLGIPDSRVMKKYALDRGVPESRIFEEGKSKDTYENLVYSLKIIEKHHFQKPLFAVYDLHARRVQQTAGALGITDFYFISATSKGEPAHGWKYFQTFSRLTIFLYELGASLYFLFRYP